MGAESAESSISSTLSPWVEIYPHSTYKCKPGRVGGFTWASVPKDIRWWNLGKKEKTLWSRSDGGDCGPQKNSIISLNMSVSTWSPKGLLCVEGSGSFSSHSVVPSPHHSPSRWSPMACTDDPQPHPRWALSVSHVLPHVFELRLTVELHMGKLKQEQVLPPPGFVWLLTLLPAPVQCSNPLFFQFNINGFMLPLIFQINMTQVRENSPVTNQPWERKVFVDGSFLPAKLGASVGICPLVGGCEPVCPLWSTHVVGSPCNRAASWQRMSDTGAWLWSIPAYLLFRWRHLGEEHIFIMWSKCQNERKKVLCTWIIEGKLKTSINHYFGR